MSDSVNDNDDMEIRDGETPDPHGTVEYDPPIPESETTSPEFVQVRRELDVIRKLKDLYRAEKVEQIGEGGMAYVFRIYLRQSHDIIIVKVPKFPLDDDVRERFRIEIEAMRSLQKKSNNANFVSLIYRADGEFLFYEMEYVDGGNLRDWLEKNQSSMEPRRIAKLMQVIVETIQLAHENKPNGIIHRDLKPANILMTKEGQPKIADFGVAKFLNAPSTLTAPGGSPGTPYYMAPEQCDGEVDERVDIWALGVILFEMLAGKRPFGGTRDEVRHNIKTLELRPPSGFESNEARDLWRICLKCLQKNPKDRYQTAAKLADDLRHVADGSNLSPRRPGAMILAVSFVTALLIVGTLIFLTMDNDKSQELDPLRSTNVLDVKSTEGNNPPREKIGWQVNYEFKTTDASNCEFEQIWFPEPNTGYIASKRSLYKTSNGGRIWDPVEAKGLTLNGDRVTFLWFRDQETGWLGTDSLWSTSNAGGDWTKEELPRQEIKSVRAFTISPNETAFAIGELHDGSRIMFRKSKEASFWTEWNVTSSELSLEDAADQPLSVLTIDDDTAIGLFTRGTTGVILKGSTATKNWREVHSDQETITSLCVDNNGRGWALGLSKIWKTNDSGEHWDPQETTDGSLKSMQFLAIDPKGQFGLGPMYSGPGATNPFRFWQLRSDGIWSLAPEEKSFDGVNIASICAVDEHCVYVLGKCGQVLKYSLK